MSRTPVRKRKPKKSSTKKKARKSKAKPKRKIKRKPPAKPKRKRKTATRKAATPRKRRALREPANDADFDFEDGGDEDPELVTWDHDEDEGGGDLPTFGDNDDAMFEGARDLYEGVYSKDEITEYIDELADYLDMDAHDLFDMFYGYSEAVAA